jgi:kinesin family protein 4/21/27
MVNEQIFKEEVFDLLDPNSAAFSKGEWVNAAKPAVPSRVPIQIRETANGGITLAGVTEAEVRNKEEMASYLSRGSLSRATGSTNMNSQSRCGFHHVTYSNLVFVFVLT